MSCFSEPGVLWPCRTFGILSQRRRAEGFCRKDGSTHRTPSCAPTNWSLSNLKSGACKPVWSSLYTRSGQTIFGGKKHVVDEFQPAYIIVWARGVLSFALKTCDTQPWARSAVPLSPSTISALFASHSLPCSTTSLFLGCRISTLYLSFPKSILLQHLSLRSAVPALSLPKAPTHTHWRQVHYSQANTRSVPHKS